MKFMKVLVSVMSAVSCTVALAVGPAPAPMKQKEVLSVGFVKVGHLSPC